MQITMPHSGRLAGKSESFELLRSKDNALMFCNIQPKQPFNKPVHKTFSDEKNISACRTMRMWLHFLPWQCKGSRRNAAVLMVCRVRPSLHS